MSMSGRGQWKKGGSGDLGCKIERDMGNGFVNRLHYMQMTGFALTYDRFVTNEGNERTGDGRDRRVVYLLPSFFLPRFLSSSVSHSCIDSAHGMLACLLACLLACTFL